MLQGIMGVTNQEVLDNSILLLGLMVPWQAWQIRHIRTFVQQVLFIIHLLLLALSPVILVYLSLQLLFQILPFVLLLPDCLLSLLSNFVSQLPILHTVVGYFMQTVISLLGCLIFVVLSVKYACLFYLFCFLVLLSLFSCLFLLSFVLTG
jgi:hypothetical protein